MSNHLTSIEARQRRSRVRDLMFAAFVVLASVVSLASVSTAAQAASTSVASR